MDIVERESPGKLPPTTSKIGNNWVVNGRTYAMHTITLPSGDPAQEDGAISCLLNPDLIPLLPDPPPQTHKPIENPCFAVRYTKNKGAGQFATRDIPAGALVLVDHPALILPAGNFPSEVYDELGARLPEGRRKELMALSNCRSSEECGSAVEGIVLTNALQLELDPKRKIPRKEREVYGGVYPLLNRGNHSCGPNVGVKWNLANLTLSLYALRPIREGEEILKTYLDPALPRATRVATLQKNYRFLCDCPWCNVCKAGNVIEDDNLTDAELKLIAESDQRRAALGSWISTHLGYRKWYADLARPDDLVITSHLEALALMEQEGMQGMQPIFIEELAMCYASLGDVDKFKQWGERVIALAQVGDPPMAKKFEEWLVDPERRMKKWAWRKRQRENAPGRSKLKAGNFVEPLFPVDALHVLFQFPD